MLFLFCPSVLHTGKRWFIICPVAEHPAPEAPESSPPLPLSSMPPEASQGMSSPRPRKPLPVSRAGLLLCMTQPVCARCPGPCRGLALPCHPWHREACGAVLLSLFSAESAQSKQPPGLSLLCYPTKQVALMATQVSAEDLHCPSFTVLTWQLLAPVPFLCAAHLQQTRLC